MAGTEDDYDNDSSENDVLLPPHVQLPATAASASAGPATSTSENFNRNNRKNVVK